MLWTSLNRPLQRELSFYLRPEILWSYCSTHSPEILFFRYVRYVYMHIHVCIHMHPGLCVEVRGQPEERLRLSSEDCADPREWTSVVSPGDKPLQPLSHLTSVMMKNESRGFSFFVRNALPASTFVFFSSKRGKAIVLCPSDFLQYVCQVDKCTTVLRLQSYSDHFYSAVHGSWWFLVGFC